jgi:aspartate aminotransferase-like enzyme
MKASFLTGPVPLSVEVRTAFLTPPASHRSAAFLDSMRRIRASLCSLVEANDVAVMVGSGTLANDAVAAQIRCMDGPGLILSNGEFGDRLVDHAQRWELAFTIERRPWGQAFDWSETRRLAARLDPKWIWAVITETSTGVVNPLEELRALSRSVRASLCVDAISAIGLLPLDLRGVRLATASSGKGLACYPGLAMVFHEGALAESYRVPRYLDIAGYAAADGVPFTHSSNLVAALECSLTSTDWKRKFNEVRSASRSLRAELRRLGLFPVAPEASAAPGVITLALPAHADSTHVATALERRGFELASQSCYLRERNWVQIALMGEIDRAALAALPRALRREVPVPTPALTPRRAG